MTEAPRSYPGREQVSFPRWWIQQIRDQLFTWGKLPSGPLGDWAFLFREQLNDKLAEPSVPAQGSADCGEVAELRAKLDLAIKGIRDFTEGHYDNPRQYRPEPCKHGQRWYEGCQSCDDAFMEQLASSLSSTPRECQFPKCGCPGSPLDPVCALTSSESK